MASNINKPSAKAFTLIEILLVMLLLSIVAVVIIPNFGKTYKQLLLSKTTESMVDLMRYAQSRSIMIGGQVQFRFEDDYSGYQLLQYDEKSKEFKSIANRMGQLFKVPIEIKVIAEKTEIAFFSSGKIEGFECEVCLDEQCYVITSELQRGFIKVFEKEE